MNVVLVYHLKGQHFFTQVACLQGHSPLCFFGNFLRSSTQWDAALGLSRRHMLQILHASTSDRPRELTGLTLPRKYLYVHLQLANVFRAFFFCVPRSTLMRYLQVSAKHTLSEV